MCARERERENACVRESERMHVCCVCVCVCLRGKCIAFAAMGPWLLRWYLKRGGMSLCVCLWHVCEREREREREREDACV